MTRYTETDDVSDDVTIPIISLLCLKSWLSQTLQTAMSQTRYTQLMQSTLYIVVVAL